MNTRKTIPMLILGMTLSGISCAQESVNSSGVNASGSGGNVSYSIGQLTFNEYSNGTGSVAQGVQHAYEIVTLSVMDSGLDISVNVFPNPTVDQLTLSVTNQTQLALTYELRDLNGKLIAEGKVEDNQTSIDMQAFTPASYFMNVISNQQTIQSFKIIKN